MAEEYASIGECDPGNDESFMVNRRDFIAYLEECLEIDPSPITLEPNLTLESGGRTIIYRHVVSANQEDRKLNGYESPKIFYNQDSGRKFNRESEIEELIGDFETEFKKRELITSRKKGSLMVSSKT